MITVIIPTYGMPVFLDKTIESVVNQTYNNWELIIVDDNNPNTDARVATEKLVCERIQKDKRISYIKHDSNRNGAVARNTGFAAAKGEYIALLDSDDEYTPERLERCYEKMLSAPKDVAGVYTGCEFRRKGKVYRQFTDVQTGRFLEDTLACTFMFCTGSNIFVRKSVIDELQGFDPTFLRQQDYEFLVRLFERYSLIGIPEVLVVKNNENFNVPNIDKQIAIREKYLGKFSGIIKSLPKDTQNYIFFSNHIALAETAMSQNKFSVANEYYKKAQNYGSLSMRNWLRRIAFPFYNLIK